MPPHRYVGSPYGEDILKFTQGFQEHTASAHDTARHVLTHAGQYPPALAIDSLGFLDRAVFEVLREYRNVPLVPEPPAEGNPTPFRMYVNSLGRLHIRKAADETVRYDANNTVVDLGYFGLAPDLWRQAQGRFRVLAAVEQRQFARLRCAVDEEDAAGNLANILEQVIDHVEHVESVCFYVGDKFYARIERLVNLVQVRGSAGLLPSLRGRPYAEWSNDAILIVAALHALFLSGKAVRFEEFNGVTLTATAVWDKLKGLSRAYRAAGAADAPADGGLFRFAQGVRAQSLPSAGADWLRYRWIYGINFQKVERILPTTKSMESPFAGVIEFAEEYVALVSAAPHAQMSETALFTALAEAALERDLCGVACTKGGVAAKGWVEHLIEQIVASAVRATSSDYGMSSSLRDLSRLLERDEGRLLATLHQLKPPDFFTCFVSRGFRTTDAERAEAIARSVQRRMMFNRWHFIPGNFERSKIEDGRHWYYPPVLPDIAIHSDVHRGAHSRAGVKFSIRAPGPDMSRPPLTIASRPYRGFYDVRVVRMAGPEFTTEEMLRTRRRTLWLGSVYEVLVQHAQRGDSLPIAGFQPGTYLDIEDDPVVREPSDLTTRPVALQKCSG